MRTLLFITAMLCIMQGKAQVLCNTVKTTRSEIDMFMQSKLSAADNEYFTLFGLQYKRWRNTNVAYKLMLGYADYTSAIHPYFEGAAHDTVITKSTMRNVGLAVIGTGIEVQKRLYKKLHVFATLELKGGYGSGKIDSLTERGYQNNNSSYHFIESTAYSNANMFYLNFAPAVGAKFMFPHFSFGVELLGIDASVKNVMPKNGHSINSFDMSAGDFAHRVFFGYIF